VTCRLRRRLEPLDSDRVATFITEVPLVRRERLRSVSFT
jgi:hypothetical protein